MLGRGVEGHVHLEELLALGLEDAHANGVGGDGILADDEALVLPGVVGVEGVRALAEKERVQHDEDVEARHVAANGEVPESGEVGAGVVVRFPGLGVEHDIVFNEAPHPGPVVRAQGAGVDEGGGPLEDRVPQDAAVVDADVFFGDAGAHDTLFDVLLELLGRR